ncbi:pentatricopeptide repeat-containing protein At3g18110, chloroplastic [Nicotiana sylvestris]|uniref:Pentatricopeptide repeat-containing protein At3g18110, chloroplastic n=1 Tax=Nicotiana sylvestris TaxID=4096 RepID=A0A1U7VHW5_NICSY|nr:PREDICTED: pentatricopeptide repeat-containing protein At3g18110, chloroplastic [Nicotiana sylvestris]XP_016434441.1 PREDICTED: pentatricopeptide repeat-containing protein At3g18110, chloroplastic-like [Nicotiana tabacum]
MTSTALLSIPPPQLKSATKSKVQRKTSVYCSLDCSTSATTTSTVNDQDTPKKFTYSRASPSARWPHLKFTDTHQNSQPPQLSVPVTSIKDVEFDTESDVKEESLNSNDENQEVLGRPSRTKAKKMTKVALKRAKDWRKRVQFLTDKILELKSEEFVADVLDEKMVQMTPTDFCFVVKWVGQSSWQRALEVYEWLNLRHWYSPNARMLATILAVLGKANQEALAVEIFMRAEQNVGNTVQVYNAMMGVYARNGRFSRVQELLDLMHERGFEPDLVSFNTLINARLKSGPMTPNLAIELLNEVRSSGIQPDIITYNTLISACSRELNVEEAVKVFNDMERHRCQPDLWTYNAMISVFGRCGMDGEAAKLFNELEANGFYPDAVTYNSLLHAFAKQGNIEKVKEICEEMVNMGFGEDEMTYNTIIDMHGKHGRHDLALQVYRDMISSGRSPDVVTYTILIDSLGKASKMAEASKVMSEMLNAGVKPTVRTYSALICGYAKVGKRVEAEEVFDCMVRSGIRPDHLAYTVVLDMNLRSGVTKKAMLLYHEMVRNGFAPDLDLYEFMLRALGRGNEEENIQIVIKDLKELGNLSPESISSLLIKGECYDFAAKMLRLAVEEGSNFNYDDLLAILGSYSSSGKILEAIELLNFVKEHDSRSKKLITDASIIINCKAQNLDAALNEYHETSKSDSYNFSFAVYESLIRCCEEAEQFAEASQIFSDMRAGGVEPSRDICRIMAVIYCKMGFPETAHYLIDQLEGNGMPPGDNSIHVSLIEAYGKLKVVQKAESVVATLEERYGVVERTAWNALIQAYALSGFYEKARAVFNTMMRNGPSPTVDTINNLIQALIVDGRLNELYVLIQELQDMGFKISKSSILLMLEAFAQAGDIFEVKKIYNGMKEAGYLPTMHLYRLIIGLLCRTKQVRDAEAMLSEMEVAGFKPDLSIWNSMLKLYTRIEDFKKTVHVYQRIQEAGLKPDVDTYNTLIIMYCRDRRPNEALVLFHEMKRLGLSPERDTYKSLIAAFCKELMLEQAEELFESLRSEGHNLDRSFYHLMMKMYRSSGNHSQAEKLIDKMKESGVEPSDATMHLLMTSYGTSGHPIEAEKVLNSLKSNGVNLSTLQYGSVIDAYLKSRDYNTGLLKLKEMIGEGLEPDHRIWTCFIRAASLCEYVTEAKTLLTAVADAGFSLPIRLLTEKSESLVLDVDLYLEKIEAVEDKAALNFVNALEDLLWAFELRATASWIFQLAIKRNIYHTDVFRVADKDWGADFRKLSAGAALVGLTLWLDHMQDASLEGFPESPKSVILITGKSEYNKVSLNSTVKAYLWEMGSPFLPCKTRTGILVAKAHSLRMWLKDSPFCLDLELKDRPSLPEMNSMQLIEGCFIRRGLVPAFEDINERLGSVSPRKFARLALLSDEKREKVIQADIEGRREKLAKLKNTAVTMRKNTKSFRMKKFVRVPGPAKSNGFA